MINPQKTSLCNGHIKTDNSLLKITDCIYMKFRKHCNIIDGYYYILICTNTTGIKSEYQFWLKIHA